ncbi:MAG: nucleotidyltransferase family protein [Rhodospirillales bacterium]
MSNWMNSCISAAATIGDAITAINEDGYEIALVVDDAQRLLGTVTDGDVRRGLLAGYDWMTPVARIMNDHPVTRTPDSDRGEILDQMKRHLYRQMPLIDGDRVVGLMHIRELMPPVDVRPNTVVLMAGGLGERLRPLTRDTPKPLLNIGDKPILETILDRFATQKFRNFYVAVNYRATDIMDHFGDGSKWGVGIRYLQEEKRLGTAGALRLIREQAEGPMIVMNGDLLTRINFQDLLDYHEQHRAAATMCVRQYDIQVPFGVIETQGAAIQMIDEKPVQRFLVNAGIYVLDPGIIELIPADRCFDMTELFSAAIEARRKTAAFPVYEYWLDVGRLDDLEKANLDFKNGVAR